MKKWAAMVTICTILSGCSYHRSCQRAGFDAFQEGFDSLPETSELHEIVVLKEVFVHIVSDRFQFPWKTAREESNGVVGYATSGNRIYIMGKIQKGRIVINPAVLGHELNHLLNYKNPKFINPDDL